jgi:hypothetical protein
MPLTPAQPATFKAHPLASGLVGRWLPNETGGLNDPRSDARIAGPVQFPLEIFKPLSIPTIKDHKCH